MDIIKQKLKDFREALLQIMEEFDVISFIDDDLQNYEMVKELGILSLRRV